MKKIILGDNLSLATLRKIDRAFDESLDYLKQVLPKFEEVKNDDVLLCGVKSVGDSGGVDFDRHENYVQIMLETNRKHTAKNLVATICFTVIMNYLTKTREKDFGNKFVFDVCRTGVGLYLINQHEAGWSLDAFEDTLFMDGVECARKIIGGQEKYDSGVWFDGIGEFSDCFMWFFGEKIISSLADKGCDLFTITEQSIKGQIFCH
jgi:hypothetical protein